MSIRPIFFCALITLTALTACGTKGPLYLPEPEPTPDSGSPADSGS